MTHFPTVKGILETNARLLDNVVKTLTEDQRIALVQFILTKCHLVAVSTPDLEAAYRIFSVLNTRGLDLTATDILKAQIIGRIPELNRDSYNTKWEDIEEDLGRNDFESLFGHIRMIYRKAKPQGSLLAEFRDHVVSQTEPEQLIDDVLTPMAAVYEELTDAAYTSTERAEAVNESLKWLGRLEFNDWLPPALAFAVRHRGEPAQMERFFRELERLAFGLLLSRCGGNERIERFAKLTLAVEHGEDLRTESSPLQLTRSEQFDVYAMISGPVYETLSARPRTLFLLRLDSLLSGGGATYDFPTVSVEHVLPQNPSADSKWLGWFPDPIERENLVHSLGNLALLARKKNSAASNYEFDQKKLVYFARGGISPFVLTTQVIKEAVWTPRVVRDRQKVLVQTLEAHLLTSR